MLTDGYQEGEIIECPVHGGRCDIRTGAPNAFPSQIAIATYSAVIEDSHIAIESPSET